MIHMFHVSETIGMIVIMVSRFIWSSPCTYAGLRIFRIPVGMILLGQLIIGGLDLIGGGVTFQTKIFI